MSASSARVTATAAEWGSGRVRLRQKGLAGRKILESLLRRHYRGKTDKPRGPGAAHQTGAVNVRCGRRDASRWTDCGPRSGGTPDRVHTTVTARCNDSRAANRPTRCRRLRRPGQCGAGAARRTNSCASAATTRPTAAGSPSSTARSSPDHIDDLRQGRHPARACRAGPTRAAPRRSGWSRRRSAPTRSPRWPRASRSMATNSQVYGGVAGEDPRTNAAADATAGQIRLAGGAPGSPNSPRRLVATPAGGNFPAVTTTATASPTHEWNGGLRQYWPAFGVGALKALEVTQTRQTGTHNGRAIKVKATGSSGSKRSPARRRVRYLQLKSSWF